MTQRNPAISKGIDWPLVWIWAILCCIGVTCIFAEPATWKFWLNLPYGWRSGSGEVEIVAFFGVFSMACY